MEERTYTQTKLKNRISKYKKITFGSFVTMVIGAGLITSLNFIKYPAKTIIMKMPRPYNVDLFLIGIRNS